MFQVSQFNEWVLIKIYHLYFTTNQKSGKHFVTDSPRITNAASKAAFVGVIRRLSPR
jgi:hypothetical protein